MNSYNFYDDIFNNVLVLYAGLIVILIERLYHYTRYWKYIILPYSLNLHSTFKSDNNNTSIHLDKFLKFTKIKGTSLDDIKAVGLESFSLEYKNFVSIKVEDYKENSEFILHFLGLIDKKYELKVYHQKNKNVILLFYRLPASYIIDYSYFKPQKLFLGIYERGLYYRNLKDLDHMLCVGESGSGKSNFMHLLNLNFLFNLQHFKKLYMVDLKGGVELMRYKKFNNVEFVCDIQRLDILLNDVLQDLKDTQVEMLRSNKRRIDSYIAIIFDEIGALSVYPDKRLRESIFDKLALISMQGRASGILLFLYTQKVDNMILPSAIVNNLQTRVLLKTSNDNNINIIDLKDNIRENITWIEIQDFNKGRSIYKDGLTSDKSLIQFPLIEDDFLDSIIKLDMLDISIILQYRKPL